MEAATTDACIQLLGEHGLREQTLGSILRAVQERLEHRASGAFQIGALMFSNVYGLLGMTEEAQGILKSWEGRQG